MKSIMIYLLSLYQLVSLAISTVIGHRLATNVFIGKLPATRGGMGDHRVHVGQRWDRAGVMGQQTTYETLTGVHSTMYLVHPN